MALPRGGLLVSVLVLPLTIPVLIFGVIGELCRGRRSRPVSAALPAFLSHLTLFFAVIGPVAAALALRCASD